MDNNNQNNPTNGFLKPEEKEFRAFYKREMWWVNHQVGLRKIGLGIFIVFDLILVLLAGWFFIDAYAVSFDQEKNSVISMVSSGLSELRDFSQSEAAKPLGVGEVAVVSSGDDKNYDFYATIANQNTDWYATFKYAFKMSGGETAELNGFILPAEERPLILFKAATTKTPSVELIVRDVKWYRVDPHEISDYPTWFADHNPQISEAVFSRADDNNQAAVAFKIKNQTAYNFYQPSFAVILWRGGTLGGIVRITAASLESGEEKVLSASWLGAAPSITKIDVYSEINFFASESYSSPEGIQSNDTRTQIETK